MQQITRHVPPKSQLSQVGLPTHAFRQVISVFIIYFSVSDPQKEEQARSLREEDARQKSCCEDDGHCEEGCQKSCREKEGCKDSEGPLRLQEKPRGKEVRPRELTATCFRGPSRSVACTSPPFILFLTTRYMTRTKN